MASAHIKALGYTKKGHALALTGDKEIEVPALLKGEEAYVRLCGKKKRRLRGVLEELTYRSADRVASRCVHVGTCGGCSLQSLTYSRQLEEKEETIRRLFAPLIHSDTVLYPMIPSPEIWAYRNKMEYSFSQDLQGNRYLGLIQTHTRGKVVSLEECHLASPWYVAVKQVVEKWWDEENLVPFVPHKGEGLLVSLVVRSSDTGKMVNLIVSGKPAYALSKSQIHRLVEKICSPFSVDEQASLSVFLTLKHAIPGKQTSYSELHLFGPSHLEETVVFRDRTFSFHISPSSFFQPNRYTVEILYEQAYRLLNPSPEDCIADLFCGSGTMALLFASRVKHIIGIEWNKAAICDARENALRNQVENVLFFADDVTRFTTETAEHFDAVIIDPPRSGLEKKGVAAIAALQAKKVLYISCNPYTQAEDIQSLASLYRVSAVQPLDQFPHTYHIENLVLLERK